MAKRFQLLKEFGRTTKKPKLDISINKGRVIPAQPYFRAESAQTHQASPPSIGTTGNNNFWEDDDDDVILLATQVAESQAHITDSEITFGEFARHASASTQRPAEDQLTFMLDGEEDDAMLAAAVVIEEHVTQSSGMAMDTNANAASEMPVFKVPIAPTAEFVATSQSDARRQLASERQIKFLTERLDVLKKENLKLNKDLSDNKSKMENKEGEATLLRDELRHMKQQIQTLKMEKIFSTEAAKSECKTKIVELSKSVKAKETALQLKSIECSVLKMRHADETQRIEMSFCDSSLLPAMNDENEEPAQLHSFQRAAMMTERRNLIRMRNLSLKVPSSTLCVPSVPNVSELTFVQTNERGVAKQRVPFEHELEQIQTIMAQLQLYLRNGISKEKTCVFTGIIIKSVSKVFPEFWSYVHSLEFPKNCRIHPYHDYNLQLDAFEERSLHQSLELYVNERALNLRRYVTTLSVLCRQLPSLSQALLTHQHGECSLLQITNDAIGKLGYSREICEHFGLIESFATLLHALLSNVTPATNETSQSTLVGLLKQLIFTRPSPWIFREITACILECTRLPHALSQLCVNSAANTFRSDRVCSLYRFSNESCILQVYAGLLEIAFPLKTPLRSQHFELMSVICANHLRFVYFCFANPPRFIHSMLPLYEDDDEAEGGCDEVTAQKEGDESSTVMSNGEFESNDGSHGFSSNSTSHAACAVGDVITCQCYTKLCLSVVTLVFQLLRHWLRAEKSSATTRVAEISKIAVQLLHIIFCDNYLTCLFREAEETTKHYLFLICMWWEENALLLHFGDFHMNFLRKLQKSHVMPKHVSDEENLLNIDNDLAEWYRMTKDVEEQCATTSVAAARDLQLLETSRVVEKFYVGLQGYAFNFQ